MDKKNDQKEHPEIENTKNICDISSDTKESSGVCDKIKKETGDVKSSSKPTKNK